MSRARLAAGALIARPALLVFIFLASFYMLTMGVNRAGYGYSPDGTFAFEMAKSLVIDPEHKYLRQYYGNFSRWGIGMPILLAPVVAAAEPLSNIAPQRDRLPIEGEEYFLTHFPSISHPSFPDARAELGLQIPPLPITELNLVSHTGLSQDIPQGTEIASMRIVEADGEILLLPIRAGIETAEWAYERADVQLTIQHEAGEGGWQAHRQHAGQLLLRQFQVHRADRPGYGAHQVHGPARPLFRGCGGSAGGRYGRVAEFSGAGPDLVGAPEQGVFPEILGSADQRAVDGGDGGAGAQGGSPARLQAGVAVAVTLSYALATMAWPFAKLDFAEPGVTFFLVAAVLALLRYGDTFRHRWALLASVLVMAAILTKYVAVIALPVFVVQIAMMHRQAGAAWREIPARSWRAGAVFASPYLLILLPGLALLSVVYDFRLLYESELLAGLSRGWLGVPLWLGMWGLLVSWGKSFFLYNPIMLLAAPAGIWFVRRHGWKSTLFVGIPLVYLAIYSKKEVWYGREYLGAAVPVAGDSTSDGDVGAAI